MELVDEKKYVYLLISYIIKDCYTNLNDSNHEVSKFLFV